MVKVISGNETPRELNRRNPKMFVRDHYASFNGSTFELSTGHHIDLSDVRIEDVDTSSIRTGIINIPFGEVSHIEADNILFFIKKGQCATNKNITHICKSITTTISNVRSNIDDELSNYNVNNLAQWIDIDLKFSINTFKHTEDNTELLNRILNVYKQHYMTEIYSPDLLQNPDGEITEFSKLINSFGIDSLTLDKTIYTKKIRLKYNPGQQCYCYKGITHISYSYKKMKLMFGISFNIVFDLNTKKFILKELNLINDAGSYTVMIDEGFSIIEEFIQEDQNYVANSIVYKNIAYYENALGQFGLIKGSIDMFSFDNDSALIEYMTWNEKREQEQILINTEEI